MQPALSLSSPEMKWPKCAKSAYTQCCAVALCEPPSQLQTVFFMQSAPICAPELYQVCVPICVAQVDVPVTGVCVDVPVTVEREVWVWVWRMYVHVWVCLHGCACVGGEGVGAHTYVHRCGCAYDTTVTCCMCAVHPVGVRAEPSFIPVLRTSSGTSEAVPACLPPKPGPTASAPLPKAPVTVVCMHSDSAHL